MTFAPRLLGHFPLSQLLRNSVVCVAGTVNCKISVNVNKQSSCLSRRTYATKMPNLPGVPSKNGPGIQKHISALKYKSRNAAYKKRLTPGKDEWSIVGYSVAESFDIIGLSEGLVEQRIYDQIRLGYYCHTHLADFDFNLATLR